MLVLQLYSRVYMSLTSTVHTTEVSCEWTTHRLYAINGVDAILRLIVHLNLVQYSTGLLVGSQHRLTLLVIWP